MSGEGILATIHGRGRSRLDAVSDLVQSLAQNRPLASALDEIPARVASVFSSEVCSVYLREGSDLVMRGNVGFDGEALGEVRLAVGEGLVGTAVETARPVTSDTATTHARARVFPSLGEERYPAFLAVPVPGAVGTAGAVVVQRSGAAYTEADIELLVALAGAMAPLLERARIVDAQAPRPSSPSGVRRVSLPGRALVKGRALGVAFALRRPEVRATRTTGKAKADLTRTLAKAIEGCDTTLDLALREAHRKGLDSAMIERARMILDDARLTERTMELAPERGLASALCEVAREVTRAARQTDVAMVTERAQDMADLCDVLRMLAAPESLATIPEGAVWLGDELTVFDVVMGIRRRPAGVLVARRVMRTERTRWVLDLLGVPAVGEVGGLYNWVSDGDVVLIDADHGLVRVNPTRRERDEARVARGSLPG